MLASDTLAVTSRPSLAVASGLGRLPWRQIHIGTHPSADWEVAEVLLSVDQLRLADQLRHEPAAGASRYGQGRRAFGRVWGCRPRNGSTGSLSLVFEQYQKARTQFVQMVAELATRPQNIETLQNAGEPAPHALPACLSSCPAGSGGHFGTPNLRCP